MPRPGESRATLPALHRVEVHAHLVGQRLLGEEPSEAELRQSSHEHPTVGSCPQVYHEDTEKQTRVYPKCVDATLLFVVFLW